MYYNSTSIAKLQQIFAEKLTLFYMSSTKAASARRSDSE